MRVKIKKPILVAGIGLSFFLWLWDSLHNQLTSVGELSLWAVIALGSGCWFFYRHRQPPPVKPTATSVLKKETVERVIAEAQKRIIELETEAPEKDISILKQQVKELAPKFARQSIQIAITGDRKVGKSSLQQALNLPQIAENIQIVETILTPKSPTLLSDVVLFITTGDLTDSEWQLLQQYHLNHQRVILLLNKQDRYLPEDVEIVLQQLKQRVQNLISPADVMVVATAPNAIKVRKYRADGSLQEWMENQPPNLGNLESHLRQIISQEKEQLIWGTIWREAQILKQEGKIILNEVRRYRAIPIIEQYQWVAAAAAFANPVSALDLLATAAINTQMVIDLSLIYRQKFSLSQAQTLAGTVGKLMVKLGLVELSTQAVGSLLKSNAVTYVAGGIVQGVSAAYLTRLAGLSLIEYLQEQEVNIESAGELNLDRLTQKLTQVFQDNQGAALLKNFVTQAVKSMPNPKLSAQNFC